MSETESKNKHYVPFIGLLEDYVGRSPWDYYSWGHIAFGIGAFSLYSLIITIWELAIGPAPVPWYLILLLVFISAVIWEIFENTVLWRLGLKYEHRKDTFVNAFFDIFFAVLGGLVTWLLKWIIMDLIGERGRWFYVSSLCLFLLVIIAYFIGFYITNEKTKKARKKLGKTIS
ncbi:MAG: hypothetical protein ACFFDF_14730 [Candidatus Odinarchaeota archaeon]